MPETETRELKGHQARSATTVHGWPSLLLGLPFLLIGLSVVLLAGGVIPGVQEQERAPRAFVAMFGALFGLAGLSFVVHGARGISRKAAWKRLQAMHPDEPWQADHAWDAEGVWDDTGQRILKTFYAGFAMAIFMVPFNWIFVLRERHPFGMAIVGPFDVIIAGILGYGVYLIARRLKYGTTYLRFERFPFVLGDAIDVRFGTSKGIGAFDRLSFTLRCIQERYETRGSGENRSQQVVCYQRYTDSLVMDEAGLFQGGDAECPLAFPLPDDAELTTALAERPPRYWELEIRADTPGVDFRATYLVPVYAPPGAAVEASTATEA